MKGRKGTKMFSVQLQMSNTVLSLPLPENSAIVGKCKKTTNFIPLKPNLRSRRIKQCCTSSSQESLRTQFQPEIELEFLGPKPESDGSYPVEKAKALSGEKLLRNIMSDNKIELYATYGKVINCGGSGSCGTCIIEIIDGKDLLNERTYTELQYLKKKPESWRLACQTIVGNKENSGKVVVQRIPQWKK